MDLVSIPNSFIKLLLIILFFLLSYNSSFAQDVAGIGIKPAIIEDKLDPDTNRNYSIEIRNLSSYDQVFYLSKQNIIDVKEGGVPIFSDGNSKKTNYELSDWITLERDSLLIPAGMSQSVSLTLNAPKDASPGSHFGGIIVSIEPPEIKTSGANIGYKVANIIHIRVSGNAFESAKIKQFSTNKFIQSEIDVDFLVRIENEGDTLLKPNGLLEIYNMLGQNVATLKFNDNFSGVFPKTTENFVVDWTDDRLGFGYYKATLSTIYGNDDKMKTISSTANFWILPTSIVGPALCLLTVLFLIIYYGVRAYMGRSLAIINSGSNRQLINRHRRNEFPILIIIVIMIIITILLGMILLLLFS